MKKLNHIWIFSDSILGHEIQSRALASKISNEISLFHCGLRQPWLSFAPRILPGFGKNIIWEKQKPDSAKAPDAIITCGRRMAAIGKFYKRLTNSKHIQILNPTDNPNKYDVIICPEHDRLNAANVISSKGSLHPITAFELLQYKKSCENNHESLNKKAISLFIGSPGKRFFKKMEDLASLIANQYPAHDLYICGSRRTDKKFHEQIKKAFKQAQLCWIDESDGANPYLHLLANSDVLLVTADSINMVSEACATNKTVIVLAQNNASAKHKRFIQSLQGRLSEFGTRHSNPVPLDTLTHVAQQVILNLKKNHR